MYDICTYITISINRTLNRVNRYLFKRGGRSQLYDSESECDDESNCLDIELAKIIDEDEKAIFEFDWYMDQIESERNAEMKRGEEMNKEMGVEDNEHGNEKRQRKKYEFPIYNPDLAYISDYENDGVYDSEDWNGYDEEMELESEKLKVE